MGIATLSALRRVFAAALLFMLSFAADGQLSLQISISKPADGEIVYDNEGNVAVTIAMEGAGKKPAARIVLDGVQYAVAQGASSVTLENIDRGEHVLVAQIINPEGRVIAASQPVTFYLWRASALFPSRGKE